MKPKVICRMPEPMKPMNCGAKEKKLYDKHHPYGFQCGVLLLSSLSLSEAIEIKQKNRTRFSDRYVFFLLPLSIYSLFQNSLRASK